MSKLNNFSKWPFYSNGKIFYGRITTDSVFVAHAGLSVTGLPQHRIDIAREN